ncbi:MAG: hypothetical protein L0K86_22635 [Actinomycetia bacterium]|nr:hypothetical protein [Actinomycetes bacterium]
MDDLDGHGWQTRSRHPTGDGVVAYQRCHCGLWRLLVEPGYVLAERIGAGERAEDARQALDGDVGELNRGAP